MPGRPVGGEHHLPCSLVQRRTWKIRAQHFCRPSTVRPALPHVLSSDHWPAAWPGHPSHLFKNFPVAVLVDSYGHFLTDVLREERIRDVERISSGSSTSSTTAGGAAAPSSINSSPDVDNATLICFVLVDPESQHSFCSAYDFGPWPLLHGIHQLPGPALDMIRSSRALFANGFVFDELPLEVVCHSVEQARSSGAAVFFDPGPR